MGEKTKKKGSISYAKWGYIFIAPFFLIFAVFQLIPLASTIYYSFFEYYRSGLKIIGPNFVGLKNYVTLFAATLCCSGSSASSRRSPSPCCWRPGSPTCASS